jgi:peptidoglycan/LPS O-acetylase OafA/YrhL
LQASSKDGRQRTRLGDGGGAAAASVDRGPRLYALDGLRALAISLVLVYHANVPGGRGGAIGVNMFFTLSGFLITGVLMRPRVLTSDGIKRFYVRRSLRLVPALAFVTLFCTVYAFLFLAESERSFVSILALTSVTYTTNFYLADFHDGTDFGLLGHTWSLAVEEQFYLA